MLLAGAHQNCCSCLKTVTFSAIPGLAFDVRGLSLDSVVHYIASADALSALPMRDLVTVHLYYIRSHLHQYYTCLYTWH
jgi:hypothetical protein